MGVNICQNNQSIFEDSILLERKDALGRQRLCGSGRTVPDKEAGNRPEISKVASFGKNLELSGVKSGDNIVSVKGTGFEVAFGKSTGSIYSLKYNDEFVITEGADLN